MGSLSINQLKSGLTIELNGTPFVVVGVDHVKPGKGAAFARTKIRNLRLETVIEKTFKTDDKIEEAFIEERNLQFSYASGNFYHFLDTNSYEDISIEKETLHETEQFLKDNLEVTALYFKNDLISIRLPNVVEYTITHTEPGIRGDTSKSGTKPAVIESGAVIQVPLFVNIGTKVKVDTRTKAYLGRA